MILKGSQRGGARQLARHLMNAADNDHVTVFELKGFLARDLQDALDEAHAISKATQCRQFLFSLSLNPPKAAVATIDQFVDAANRAEATLGLTGQPRAIIIHEKLGRRHAHVVWSRILADQLKAINMAHFKTKLAALSKELYLENDWDLPAGHKTRGWRSPLNFNLAEWQQAKRVDLDPRELKQLFRDAWQRSDSLSSFRASLEEHGYYLAQGDRRAFVAVDLQGAVYSIARWCGVKAKDVVQRLGTPERIPLVSDLSRLIQSKLRASARDHINELQRQQSDELAPLQASLQQATNAHREERERLSDALKLRWSNETKARAARLPSGLQMVWDLLTGRLFELRKRNEVEAWAAHRRDQHQRERLYREQAAEIEGLHQSIAQVRARHRNERLQLARGIATRIRRPAPAPMPVTRTPLVRRTHNTRARNPSLSL